MLSAILIGQFGYASNVWALKLLLHIISVIYSPNPLPKCGVHLGQIDGVTLNPAFVSLLLVCKLKHILESSSIPAIKLFFCQRTKYKQAAVVKLLEEHLL